MMSLGVGPWMRVRPWLPAVGARYWQAARSGLHQIPSRNPDLWYESSAYWHGLLAGGPIEDSGLVWPNETVSEGADWCRLAPMALT
jgi:hypothetical protein